MESVLSQSEVSALLNAVNQGKIDTTVDEAFTAEDAREYDITSNDRIMRGRMPVLDVLNQKMARLMRISFFNLLRKTVRVSLDSSQLVKFNEFMNTLTAPACLTVFRLPPLDGSCLVAMDPDLCFGVVDQVFGGKGGWYRIEGREYSTIELRLMERVARSVLADLASSWENILKVHPEFVRMEINSQFANVASPKDVTLLISFEVELESNNKGNITLVIPYAVIQPIRDSLSSTLQTESGRGGNPWSPAIKGMLKDMPVEMLARLGKGKLSVRELLALKVGDVIPLNSDAKAPLSCEVEGMVKIHAWPVSSRGKLAVKLAHSVGAANDKSNIKPRG